MMKVINNANCWFYPEVILVTKTEDPIKVIEYAGRFSTRTEGKEEGIEFVKKRWNDKHYSIFEHIHLGFSIRGISRILSHELVRHRLASYTQSSTRYSNIKKIECVIPPGITNQEEIYTHIEAFKMEMDIVKNMLDKGIPKERARYHLPHCIECCIYMSGNYRTFKEILKKRIIKEAAPEFIRLGKEIQSKIHEYLPIEDEIEIPNININIVEG